MVSNDATFSFAVLPPHIDGSCSSNILSQLPEVVVEKHMDERKRALEFIMHVNPKNTISRLEVERKDSVRRRIQINQDMAKMAKYHLATLPDEVGVTWDRGILIRASHQSNILSSHLSFAFPSHGISQQSSNRRKCLSDESSKKGCCFVECRKLRSCTTIILRNIEENDIEQDDVGQFLEIDREKRVWEKVEKKCGGIDHIRNKRRKTMNELKQLYSNGKINLITRTTDDNEICLSDESGEEESNDAQDHDAYEIELPDESNEVEESILVQDITGEKGFMLPEVDENEVILSEDSDSNCDRGMPEDAQHGRKRKRRTDSRHSYSESRIRKTSSSEVSETEGSGLNNLIPHLLVLGTGCASPSPFRGSSAYCLLLPTLIKVENGNKQVSLAPNLTLSAILECGEGCLNGMHRHLVSTKNFGNRSMDCLSEVRFIWISHSHLDHYGELPLVIAEIQKRTLNIRQCTCYDRSNFRRKEANISQKELRGPKCQRCGHLLPPLIIAPAKVLQFLDLSLGCKNGMSKDCGRLFFSTSSRDFNNSPFAQQLRDDVFQYELFRQPNENPSIYDEIDESKMAKYRPFRFIRHIPAWHCYDAHAILLGLCTDGVGNEGRRSESFQPSPSPLFFLCYSGDTRPSSQLVQACKEATRNYSQGISLLVHEATFDDDERGRKEALSKKHSTVTEALAIAKETDSLACLLTHFSQRYARLPPGYKKGDTYCDLNMKCKSSIGTAVDGMILPLHDSVTSTILPLLTTCTNDILSELENNDYLNRIN
jgi:ribonuclease BN (tRNA processing enzyme)